MKIYEAVLDWVLFNNNEKIENEKVKIFPSKKDQVFSIMISKEM